MSVAQLKDGRWVCRYRKDGKGKTEYFGRGLDAQQKAEEFNEDLKKKGIIRSYEKQESLKSGVKFETLAAEYLSVYGPANLTKSSLYNLEYSLAAVILPELGHLLAASLTHKRLDDYVNKRLNTPRQIRKGTRDNPKYEDMKNPDGTTKYISRSTVHRELCNIQAILNWAVLKKYLISNPVIGHKKPKRDDAILKPPTQKETRRILSKCAPHLIRALKVSYFTGLRPGAEELFRLTWADVDFEERTIFIVSAKKKGLPHRTVPLHDELLSDMTRWQKEDQEDSIDYIVSFKGKPIKSIKKAYAGALKRAGIARRIRLYDFRHAFATNFLSSGGDLKTVSEMLGHSRTDTTTKIYHHTSIELQRQEIKKLPGLKPKRIHSDENIVEYEEIKNKADNYEKKYTK